MKTIGMIGGMSWESSLEYYRIVNETVKARLGGLHSARTLMYSVDFAEIEVLQSEGRWDEATSMMIDAARRLERGGADLIVICTNTMHKMADDVQAAVGIPLLHIADATAAQIQQQRLATIGLLGTRYTMEQDFYRGRLEQMHGLRVLVPDADRRALVNRIIYEELVLGEIKAESKAAYLRIIDALVAEGAQGIILGCTEIGLLIQQQDCAVPVFDTTTIHAMAAVEAALAPITEGS
ncbi:MAG: aspartate/glutamate racemase family protein [Anaerolineae bacterium]|nr:aspartate/glutamate racemase family protein [Anaerolineae bacterium]